MTIAMISLGVLLVGGCVLTHIQGPAAARRVSAPIAVLIGVLALLPLWVSDAHWTSSAWWSVAAAVVWWLSFSWVAQAADAARHDGLRHAGWAACALAGLLLTALARDFLTAIVGVELVRQATRPGRLSALNGDDEPGDVWEFLAPVLLGLAAAGWMFVGGSQEFATLRAVLAEAYGVEGVGRPALLLVAATTATVIGVCLPVVFQWPLLSRLHPTQSQAVAMAILSARQLAAVLMLTSLCAGGLTGLETPLMVTLGLLAIAAWAVAIRWATDGQRLDRWLLGVSTWLWGTSLVWIATLLAPSAAATGPLFATSAHPAVLLAAMAHQVLACGGLSAATAWLIPQRDGACYFDELRGAGQRSPLRTSCWLVIAGSLLGLPLLAGFWIRVAWLVAVLGVQRSNRDDIMVPHALMGWGCLLGVLAWAVMAGTAVKLARRMLLEAPLSAPALKLGWWPRCLVVSVAALVTLWGCFPQSWMIEWNRDATRTASADAGPVSETAR